MIPTHAHFYRNGDVHRLDRRFHKLRRQRHFTHQGGARQLSDDLSHRATEVDVDYRSAIVLLKLGCL